MITAIPARRIGIATVAIRPKGSGKRSRQVIVVGERANRTVPNQQDGTKRGVRYFTPRLLFFPLWKITKRWSHNNILYSLFRGVVHK